MHLLDLVEVIYSAGRVFDNLRTGRLDTESFLRSGDMSGMTSRADLELLRDLRAAAEVAVDARINGQAPSAELAVQINAAMTRSAALRPGILCTDDQNIGVTTPYGRHGPPALSPEVLQSLIEGALAHSDSGDRAAHLFVALAAAQPFGDGNKRTALLLANVLLPQSSILTAPYLEEDSTVSTTFHDLLSRAYIYGETSGAADYLRTHGLREHTGDS